MQTEIESQRKLIEEIIAANTSYKLRLQHEKIEHAQTKQALEIERKLRYEATTLIDRQHQELLACQISHAATKRALEVERWRLDETAAELDRTQRTFHFVDSLVDTMLLQEDSQLDMSDRSRQVTDLILDLDMRVEAKYQSLLQEKDNRLTELRRLLPRSRSSEEECVRRAQSEPGVRYPS